MISVKVLFAVIAVACLFQIIAGYDWLKYLENQLRKVIKNENLTCESLNEFCERSVKEQFENSVDPQESNPDINEMTIQFCKVILSSYLCDKKS